MIGNGAAMGIATEILEHIFGAAEGRFGVNHPVLSEPWSQPGSEDLGLREQSQVPGKMKLAMLKSRLETDDEFAAKHAPEYLDGEKEARARSNPASVIERESAGGDDAVDMGMKREFLLPGMQHAEEADLSPEMAGVTSHFQKGFCAGPQQQTIDDLFDLFVPQGQSSQLRWQSKNDMDVGRGEKFAAPGLDPALAGARLTLRAMAIATAVIRDGGTMSATGALIDVAAKCSGATARDSNQDLDMGPADPLAVALDESRFCSAGQVGPPQGRPTHLSLRVLSSLSHQRGQRTGGSGEMGVGKGGEENGVFF